MEATPFPRNPVPESSGTATTEPARLVETLEHSRFIEFCEACKQYRYIGLCFGAPGIGKTLSAVRYSQADAIGQLDPWTPLTSARLLDTVLYTPSVVNTHGKVGVDLRSARERLLNITMRPINIERRRVLDDLRERDEAWRRVYEGDPRFGGSRCPHFKPTYFEVFSEYEDRKKAMADPTTLIVIDEADRLSITSLEQVRSIFDQGGLGVILIGMPGIEKKMARFPQLYSRICFVHEFRPLAAAEVQKLLETGWTPLGVILPRTPLRPEVLATIIRMTGGNFRLLDRLLAQIERVLKVNEAPEVTLEIVEAARESLVIGQA